MKIPRYRGARPERQNIIVGQSFHSDHIEWMPEWYRKFFAAPVERPPYKLADVLYPKEELDRYETNSKS